MRKQELLKAIQKAVVSVKQLEQENRTGDIPLVFMELAGDCEKAGLPADKFGEAIALDNEANKLFLKYIFGEDGKQ